MLLASERHLSTAANRASTAALLTLSNRSRSRRMLCAEVSITS
jgi:hypothetical protein